MSRRTKMWGSLLLVAVIALAGFFLLPRNSETVAPAHGSGTVAGASPAEQMPPTNIQALQQAINSSDVGTQAGTLASTTRSDFLQQNQLMLPPGITVRILAGQAENSVVTQNTFLADGDNGQVTAEALDQDRRVVQHYVLRLVRENGAWLILYTEETK